jgi:hypothetical protein
MGRFEGSGCGGDVERGKGHARAERNRHGAEPNVDAIAPLVKCLILGICSEDLVFESRFDVIR